MPGQSRVYTGEGAGSAGVAGDRVFAEIPGGTVNGANTVFTTSGFFVNGSEAVFYNGVRQRSGVGCDYEISESGGVGTGYDTITFAVAPRSGDNLIVDYTPV
jgi:hypothetical protein